MFDCRSLIEFIEVLANPHKWQLVTVAGSIGLVGCLVNIALMIAGKMPPKFIWNLFPVVTLTAASVEIVQHIGAKKNA